MLLTIYFITIYRPFNCLFGEHALLNQVAECEVAMADQQGLSDAEVASVCKDPDSSTKVPAKYVA